MKNKATITIDYDRFVYLCSCENRLRCIIRFLENDDLCNELFATYEVQEGETLDINL